MIRRLADILLLFAGLLCWSGAVAQTPDRVEILFLDVGQGDAAVVITPQGHVALIDAGPDERTLQLLRNREISGIDIIIASHGHADHIGGMRTIIEVLPVRYYMDNGIPHTTAAYRELLEVLLESDISYLEARDRNINLGDVKLAILPPLRQGEQNDNSVGVLVEYGQFKALFTGDSEIAELRHFLSSGVPDVTLLKAPHHGSRDGLTPAWLLATQPELVVVSCGLDNRYGHPHPWAMRYYSTVADEVYRTDLDGTVTVFGARNGTYEVHTER